MQSPDFSLQWILDPIARDEFFEAYWEARPLVISRNAPGYFDPLLSLDEIDRVITTLNLSHPDLQLVSSAEDIGARQYTYRSGMVDVAKLYQYFADGAQLALEAVTLA